MRVQDFCPFVSMTVDVGRSLAYGSVWCRHLAIVGVLNYATGERLKPAIP